MKTDLEDPRGVDLEHQHLRCKGVRHLAFYAFCAFQAHIAFNYGVWRLFVYRKPLKMTLSWKLERYYLTNWSADPS